MRVLTLNTWQEYGMWHERWEVIDAFIRETSPDVIFFQEIFSRKWAAETAARLGYEECLTHDEPAGLVMLTRFRVLEAGLLSYHSKSAAEKRNRYIQHVWLETPDAGDFLAINTHLSWRPADHGIRYRQAGELIQAVEILSEDGPVICAGDFNCDVDTSEIDLIKSRGRFRDCYAEHQPYERGWTWSHKNPYTAMPSNLLSGELMPQRRIDYIFCRPPRGFPFQSKSCRIVLDQPDSRGIWASDHFGLLAEF